MKIISVSNDIVPLSEFKTSISKWLKNVQNTGHPLIITQNGRPAGILLSPSEYDDLIHNKLFIDSVNRGISDVDTGNVYNSKELRDELKKRRDLRVLS